jgi:hypothetical protein
MSFKVGDVSFLHNGIPAVVAGKESDSGKLMLDSDQGAVKKLHRHGYLNGLEDTDRKALLNILDKVSETEQPDEKIGLLNQQIDDLSKDPRNFRLVRYLKSELTHMMNTYNVKPRYYEMPSV